MVIWSFWLCRMRDARCEMRNACAGVGQEIQNNDARVLAFTCVVALSFRTFIFYTNQLFLLTRVPTMALLLRQTFQSAFRPYKLGTILSSQYPAFSSCRILNFPQPACASASGDAASDRDAMRRERRRLRHVERYQNDSEYRERSLKRARAWYWDNLDRAKESNSMRKSKDTEWRREHLLAPTKRRLEKIRADPSLYQAYLAKCAASIHKHRLEQPRYRWRVALHLWFMRHKDHLSQFTWKLWEPICYPEKVERTCAGCGKLRLSGTKLWFRRKSSDSASDSQHEYHCFPCYAFSDWSSIAPIETTGKYRFFEPKNPEFIALRDSLKRPESAQQEDPK